MEGSMNRGFPQFAAFLLGVCTLFAQTRPPAPQQKPGQTDVTIRVGVERVPVLFTAVDRKDRYITDLAKEDVQVYDNKKKQEVLSFTQETDLPLRVGLLIDTSNSIRDRFKFEQEAAIEFLRSIIRPGKDQVFLMAFDSNTEVVQDFTDNLDLLTKAIRDLRPGGGTSLYDAVYLASRDKLMQTTAEGGVRRTLILISDGEDNLSRASREEALAMAQRAEVTLFCIGTNISGNELPGDLVLKRFALETGGRSFFPFRLEDMTTSFQNISRELRSQYALFFRPNTPRDSTFHTIEVVSLRKGVKVRARKGYFALP
jgi:VWFA-related protein